MTANRFSGPAAKPRFFGQIKVLFYKNILIRSQEKKRVVCVTAVPVVYAILLVVALSMYEVFTINYSLLYTCNFTARAMPSAGFLPFVQSYTCGHIQEPCDSRKAISKSYFGPPDEPQREITGKLLEIVQRLLADHQVVHQVGVLFQKIQTLVEMTQAIPALNQQTGQSSKISIGQLLADKADFKQKLMALGMSNSMADDLLNHHLDRRFYASVINILTKANVSGQDFNNFFALPKQKLDSILTSIKVDAICRGSTQTPGFCSFNFGQLVNANTVNRQVALDAFGSAIRSMTNQSLSMEGMLNLTTKLYSILNQDLAIDKPIGKSVDQLIFLIGAGGFEGVLCTPEVTPARGPEPRIIRSNKMEDYPANPRKLVKRQVGYTQETICGHEFNDSQLREDACRSFKKQPFYQILQGFIVFYPDSPPVRRLVDKLAKWFDKLAYFKNLFANFDSNAQDFEYAFGNSTLGQAYNVLLQVYKGIINEVGNRKKDTKMLQYLSRIGEAFGIFKLQSRTGTPKLKDILSQITLLLKCLRVDRFIILPADQSEEAANLTKCLLGNKSLLAQVIFENLTKGMNHFPKITTYKIRTTRFHPRSYGIGINQIRETIPFDSRGDHLHYHISYFYGFTLLQDLIDRIIIEEHTGKPVSMAVYSQQIPVPCSTVYWKLPTVMKIIAVTMTLMFVIIYTFIVERIVIEKENRLSEYMKVMGLGGGVQFVAFFIEAMLVLLVMFVILLATFYYCRLFMESNFVIILAFFILAAISLTTQAFLFSAFFTSASIASICSQIGYVLLLAPYFFLSGEINAWLRMLACLLSQVAIPYGLGYAFKFEQEGAGIQFHNWNESPEMNDDFSLQTCMILLAINSLLHLVLFWYISNVCPGDYGVPKPFYFFLKPSYWFNGLNRMGGNVTSDNRPSADPTVERPPRNVEVGVSIRNLKKRFSGNFLAVDNLTLDFYENQVTAFLGRNGAGKTTTMSIICGMIPPTSGDVVISGKNIRSEIGEIRQSLGLCPQHNILIDLLTVEQHLKFYAALKGLTGEYRKMEVEYYLKSLDLLDKRNVASAALSGGMKRRLSLAAAFIGGSKVVILDEPTAGVDPFARRQIWAVILKNKEDRTILMSTHYMDEAEILGDRIAIISSGKLKCAGSSLFLKSLFGSTFYLTLELVDSCRVAAQSLPTSTDRTSTSAENKSSSQKRSTSLKSKKSTNPQNSLDHIKTFVLSNIPGSKFKEYLGQCLIFTLPRENSERLAAFFDQLDKPEAKRMGIVSYGISETKMEEIFLKTDAGVTSASKKSGGIQTEKSAENKNSKASKSTRHFQLWIPFMAVYIKRFHISRRSVKSVICEILLPVLFVGLASYYYAKLLNLSGHGATQAPNEPDPLLLSPWLYGSPNYIVVSNSPDGKKSSADDVLDSMYSQPYISIGCAKARKLQNIKCKESLGSVTKSQKATIKIQDNKPQCFCEHDTKRADWHCPSGVDIPQPPMAYLPTGDYLVDVTGMDIPEWFMATYKQYNRKRYGGFSVGQRQLGRPAIGNIDWSSVTRNFDQIKNLVRNFLQQMNFDSDILEKLISGSSQTNGSNTSFTQGLEHLLKDGNAKDNITIWFNNFGWVSLPIYTNVLNNAILRANLPSGEDPSQYGIVAYSHPMPVEQRGWQLHFTPRADTRGADISQFIVIIFGLGLLFASLVTVIVNETASTAKHLQLISGLRPVVYWAANLAYDMTNLCILVSMIMVIFAIFGNEVFVGTAAQAFAAVFLFITCGFATLPMLYWFTFLFRSPSASLITFSIGYVVSSILLKMAHLSVEQNYSEEIASNATHVFMIVPSFGLLTGLTGLRLAYSNYNEKNGYAEDRNPFKMLTKIYVQMIIAGILAFLMLLFFENYRWLIFKLKCNCCKSSSAEPIKEDDDVAKERKFVQSPQSKDCAIRVDSLSKNFTQTVCGCIPKIFRPFKAVNKICFTVQKGECFGLLGINGAGKTTTLDMITGKIVPTSGDAFVCGYSVFGEKNAARAHLGLCPQFDALNLLLTAREQLTLYARIKGIPKEDMKLVVDNFIRQLDLTEFADRISKNYSGGNKRKLSVAIAMLGNPDVILLDEPVAGMDPKARRFLWNEILRMTRQGSSIILTTHSMEECEALCSRLGIMIQGTFRCIGTPQRLKNKFGGGYSLIIKLGESSSKLVDQFDSELKRQFPKVEQKCRYNLQMEYTFPNQADYHLARIFRFLIWAKSKYEIEDYSLSQTTLDDVFVSFAAQQHDKK